VSRYGFSESRNQIRHVQCSGESVEVNLSDHKYKIGYNKLNKPDIAIGGECKQIYSVSHSDQSCWTNKTVSMFRRNHVG